MTDGHVQYNAGWKFYTSLQPNMKCEFDDHRTCKERSEAFDATLSEAQQADITAQKIQRAAEIDAAAEIARVNAQKERLNEAGRRKHEATRQNGLTKSCLILTATQKQEAAVIAAQTNFDFAKRAAAVACDLEVKKAIDENIAAQKIINETDYLKLVEDEAATINAGK